MSFYQEATPGLRLLVAVFALTLISALAYLVIENQHALTAIGDEQGHRSEAPGSCQPSRAC